MGLPSLFVLADEYRNAAEQLADLDMPPEVIADTLEGMSGDLEVKATNVAMFVRNLEATAAQIKEAEAVMSARRKAIEARAARVREYIEMSMRHAGITKIECPYFSLSIKQNPLSVVIDCAAQIPPEYMRVPEPVPPQPDKKAIGDAIKAGKEVVGAHLERTTRLEIK